MTREEREKAIDLLDNLIGMVEDNQDNDYDKALKMGIESLRKEPSEDCVDRKALDKALYECFHEEDSPNNITDVRLGAVRNFVKNFPSVTPTQKWIPVKEQLPEESLNSVIGWDAYRERCVFVQYINGYFQIPGKDESFDIIAWLPLPKPYQEMESEQLLSYADQDTMQPAT